MFDFLRVSHPSRLEVDPAEMIRTVLESETYLFSPREVWVLRHILDMTCKPEKVSLLTLDGPKYLLTRLLLRLPGKVHSYSHLVDRYSPELGEEGVRVAAKQLSKSLPIPEEMANADAGELPSKKPLQPAKSYPTPTSNPRPRAKRKPWSELATGLTAEEEKADPDLAEALRESLWASKVGRVEVDDEGSIVESPTPSIRGSDRSTPVTPTDEQKLSMYSEEFSLKPKEPTPISDFAKNHSEMSLEDLMSCIPADELKKLARARKVPPTSLLTRESTVRALKRVASEQTTLGFAPLGKGKMKSQGTLPFTPSKTVTSQSLLVSALLPLLGGGAIQLTAELHALIARVNLLFTRTPPLTATSSSLMLPSILVSSHKRRYPDYGPPTRSRIWSTRDDLLSWERVVYWEGLVADALGDTWAEQKRNPVPGFGMKRDMLSRTEGAKVVKRVWEGIWPAWLELVAGDKGQAVDARTEEGGLVGDRFKIGVFHVRVGLISRSCLDENSLQGGSYAMGGLTWQGAVALGILHEYDMECEVLRALLAQRRWRRSKRG